jgi:hypothetical protein
VTVGRAGPATAVRWQDRLATPADRLADRGIPHLDEVIADLLGSYLPYQAMLRLPGPVPLLAELTWGRMVQVCVNTMGVGDGDHIAFMRERQRRCAASEHVTPHWDDMGQRRPGHLRLWTRARIGTVEARSTSLDDSVSIPAASAPARGECGTGSHIRRTFVSLRGGGGYALRHIWTLEVVATRPIRCGAAGS